MEFTPAMELDRRSITDWGQDRESAISIERLIKLSSWMMVLGTMRLICAFADYINTFFEVTRFEPITFRIASKFFEDNQPVFLVTDAWPLLLAIVLRRKRWPELLPAAGITFLILSIGGLIAFSTEWSRAQGTGGTIGSFHLTRRAFLHPTVSDLSLGVLGATQLLLELATAIRALLLLPSFRGAAAAESGRQQGARRALFGRLAVYTAIGYLVLMVRLPVWSTYLEVLNNSTIFREFVIQNDILRIRAMPEPITYTKVDERLQRTHAALTAAVDAMGAGRYAVAESYYRRVISLVDSSSPGLSPRSYQPMVAQALNNLAWLQATCPDTEFRNPSESVQNARRATELEPEDGNFWNTLGTAYYRSEKWVEAKRALSHSMEMRDGGDGFDWFVLALVQLKLGRKDEALSWYDKAVTWYHQSAPVSQELYRFQVEAAQELGLPTPVAPPRPHNAKFARAFPVEMDPARIHHGTRNVVPSSKSRGH
jgi:tetratricopeptide (TPR) repeat protein